MNQASQEAHRVVAVVGSLVPAGVPVPLLGGDPGHGPTGCLVDGRVGSEQSGGGALACPGALVPPPLGAAEGHQTSHQEDQGYLRAFSPASRTLLDWPATQAGLETIQLCSL